MSIEGGVAPSFYILFDAGHNSRGCFFAEGVGALQGRYVMDSGGDNFDSFFLRYGWSDFGSCR